MSDAPTQGIVDTSVLVRYLTGDPPAEARRARQVVEGSGLVLLSDVVLLETAHVLRTLYGVPRVELLDVLIAFLGRENVRPLDRPEDILVAALELCRPSARISIGDALIWAAATSARVPVYTFDRRFPADGIAVRFE